jgi:hypothetical protein
MRRVAEKDDAAPRSSPPSSVGTSVGVRPARSLYAVVNSLWACAATASHLWIVPVMTMSDSPVTSQAGETPRFPLITLRPVLLTLGVAPRTAKLSTVSGSTDDCAASKALARGLPVALSCARPVSVEVELLTRVFLRAVLGVELLARVLLFAVLRVELLARVREAVVRVDSLPLGAALLLLAAESVLEAETVLSDARDCEATAPSPSTTSPSRNPRSTAGHLEVACLVAARAWAFIAALSWSPGLSGPGAAVTGGEAVRGRPNPH